MKTISGFNGIGSMPFVFLKPLEVESNLPPHIARFTYDSFVDTTLSEEAKRTSTETNRDCSSSDDSVVSSSMWCCTFCDVLLEGLEKGGKGIEGKILELYRERCRVLLVNTY